jgi:uncharacterized protein (TIGR02271 family)
MTTHTITGLFESRTEAESAVSALVRQAGIDQSQISMIAQDPSEASASTGGGRYEERGFWSSLGDLFMPSEDRYTYSEGISRGGVLISVRVDEARSEAVENLLEQHGAVDLDQREAQWRKEGWTGHTGAAAVGTATGAVVGTSSSGDMTGVAAMPAATGAVPQATTATPATRLEGEEHISIAEERLRVGKRVADRGRVRVRSYVVETPVEEQVTLREETINVERRVLDRPVTDSDRLFQERTFEVTETDEEAVVQKDVVVKEELVLRKDVEEHTETIRDTVRRTEVEIEDERHGGTAASTQTSGAGRDNPPGTAGSRAVDKTLGTNISGANLKGTTGR